MSFRAWRQSAAVYLDRRILAILFLGFASGLPLALVGATLNVWLTESNVSRAMIGLFALISIPYSFKFVWAPLIDRLRLPWLTATLGRRRGWAVLIQVLLAAALLAIGQTDPVAGLWWTAAMALVVAFLSASQDIVVDAFRVEILDEPQYGAGAAAVVLGYRFGMLASGAGALYLASVLPWSTVYAVMAALMGIGVLTMLLNREPGAAATPESRAIEAGVADWLAARPALRGRRAETLAWLHSAVVAPFRQFMTRRNWVLILLFIALYKLGDAYAGVMSATFYIQTGFTKIDIANVTKVFGIWATIGGGVVGGLLVGRIGILRSLMLCGLLQMVSNMMFVLLAHAGPEIPWLIATVLVENVSGGMGTAAFVAYLSSLCNAAYTATQYALLSSLAALGLHSVAATSGLAAEQLGWPGFFTLSAALALPALLVLTVLVRRDPPAFAPGAAPALPAGGANG
ncbi:AmpG family muropeptide MFS transporter [Arenibaculum pallidiluteum]|uniref:AmpG family muropeptide MFS transporter n=1 Tax=Arenibaculum pallidiluteum TaxID=2812559 RepID=UPI001A971A10|nr:MFS transporter [Arenibaculum pallidiluteum]